MKIAKKIDLRRIEKLRKEIYKPEYQKQAIQMIALNLTDALARKDSE